ncbi:hypothetical protein ACFL0L_04310 [Patescibacteria group bacterium]
MATEDRANGTDKKPKAPISGHPRVCKCGTPYSRSASTMFGCPKCMKECNSYEEYRKEIPV